MNYCGIDLASKSSAICIAEKEGEEFCEFDLPTDEKSFTKAFGEMLPARCLLEASPLAEWAAGIIEGCGHEVVIVDPRKAAAVVRTKRKTDKLDARNLARMARSGWYCRVHRKSAQARLMRTLLGARKRAEAPNDIWTVDFKGWWQTPRGQRCEPLTIRDEYSRLILSIKALDTTGTGAVKAEFIKVFKRNGLPELIRSDNGSPFASTRSPLGLSALSVWLISQGIELDRIEPGHPEQNGGHERMHRDIRMELQGLIEGDLEDHQAAFDSWRHDFNWVRPHEALGLKVPGEVYRQVRQGLRSRDPPDRIPSSIPDPKNIKQWYAFRRRQADIHQ